MRRILLDKELNAIIENVPQPKPKSGEVLLKVGYCGICGSDLHAYEGKHPFIPLPAIPGHEFSGIIAAIGENVKEFKIGDRVIAEPNLVCGVCYNCKIGRYNICESLRVMGCQGDGALLFYQRYGFKISRIDINAINKAKQLKPEIPLIGMNGIPITDEIILEKSIVNK